MNLILIISSSIILIILAYYIGRYFGRTSRDSYWQEKLPLVKKEAINKSRAVIGGQFSEQLAPYLPHFPYKPTEVKFLGKPIDFIVFKGLDEKNVTEIIFVEVKSGDARLSKNEKNVQETVKTQKVRWEEYRIPKELTK